METCPIEHIVKEPSHEPTWKKDFPSVGEGIINFNIQRCSPFWIVVQPKKKDQNEIDPTIWVCLEVKQSSAAFKLYHKHQITTLCETTEKGVGYDENRKISYWFSFDRQSLVLKYGKGYHMTQTTLLEHDFLKGLNKHEQEEKRKELHKLFNPEFAKVIEQYDCQPCNDLLKVYIEKLISGLRFGEDGKLTVNFINDDCCSESKCTLEDDAAATAHSMIDMEGKVGFYKNPLKSNWSPVILDSTKSSLFQLDSNKYILSASLPEACQELYQNIFQQSVELDWPYDIGEYKLSDAIRHSLETKGGILQRALEKKAGEFGKYNTYLRVTLGESRGQSPGIPYVLEIWPKGHGSPIHNHGNAYAVIKVIFGGLTIHVYNKSKVSDDDEEERELMQFDVKHGDGTWISPNWYQTHKLWNTTDDFCATIQCYKYGDDDRLHWPYFDYVTTDKDVGEFVPDSDFTFREMREEVLREYKKYMETN